MAKSPSGEYRASSARGEVFYRDQIGLRLVGLLLVGSVGHESRFDSYLYRFAGCSRFLCQLAVS